MLYIAEGKKLTHLPLFPTISLLVVESVKLSFILVRGAIVLKFLKNGTLMQMILQAFIEEDVVWWW